MKKIVIKDGNFYELFKVASYKNVSLSANTLFTILEAGQIDTTKIYLVKASLDTADANIRVFNEPNYLAYLYDYTGTDPYMTFRATSANKPLRVKFSSAHTADLELYEVRKYGQFLVTSVSTTPYNPSAQDKVSIYQFPTITSGKAYHIIFTPLYSGNFTIYPVEGSTVLKQIDNVVAGETYEFDVTPDVTGALRFRTWKSGVQFWVSINEA